jgi:hypothetical protein
VKDHATFQFHMTMSYQVTPFTAQEQSDYRKLLRTHSTHDHCPTEESIISVLRTACSYQHASHLAAPIERSIVERCRVGWCCCGLL